MHVHEHVHVHIHIHYIYMGICVNNIFYMCICIHEFICFYMFRYTLCRYMYDVYMYLSTSCLFVCLNTFRFALRRESKDHDPPARYRPCFNSGFVALVLTGMVWPGSMEVASKMTRSAAFSEAQLEFLRKNPCLLARCCASWRGAPAAAGVALHICCAKAWISDVGAS